MPSFLHQHVWIWGFLLLIENDLLFHAERDYKHKIILKIGCKLDVDNHSFWAAWLKAAIRLLSLSWLACVWTRFKLNQINVIIDKCYISLWRYMVDCERPPWSLSVVVSWHRLFKLSNSSVANGDISSGDVQLAL